MPIILCNLRGIPHFKEHSGKIHLTSFQLETVTCEIKNLNLKNKYKNYEKYENLLINIFTFLS